MSVLVVGSIAFDSIETPHGRRDGAIGGSATYFAYAASHFTRVRCVSVVGEDFPTSAMDALRARGVDLDGVEIVKGGKTFRWSGRYHADMNTRETLETQLNTFGSFKPRVPASFRSTPFLFLANGGPDTQASVLDQVEKPVFVVADTMNLWIDIQRKELLDLLRRVDGIILNDEEARMLSGDRNLIAAGEKVLQMGPRVVLLKKGEHGCFLFSHFVKFALPAYPTSNVVDPTGAGDSFAGGFMGYLASTGNVTLGNMKRAMGYGTVTASIDVEDFSIDALQRCDRAEVERRYAEFIQFVTL
jgi:sugar/nucleoside kinase (ribokinase family)